MYKKIISFIITIAIALSIIGFTGSAYGKDNGFELPPEIAKMIELQQRALKAYDILRTTFTIQENKRVSYPDDFAGTWVEAPFLHIALTTDRPESVEKYRKLLKDYEDIIIYEVAKHSLNELDEIRFNVSEALSREHRISCHYVDVRENKTVFEFADFDEKSIKLSLSRITQNVDKNMFILKQGKQCDYLSELIGGDALSDRTLGICGYFNNYEGFITAGHGLKKNDKLTRESGTEIGTVSDVNFGDGEIGDYALVRLSGTAPKTMTNKVFQTTTSTRNITGTLDDLPVGAVFLKFGKITKDGAGVVTATNVSFTKYDPLPPFGITTYGLTLGTLYPGVTVAHGDSGGPIYINNNFVGIITAGVDSTVYFTPYIDFKSVFTPKTN